MPKNKLTDLNNILFEQLERLSDESLTAEELEQECKRSKSIESIAKTIITGASVALEGQKLIAEYGGYDRITKAGIEIPDALKIEGSYAER
ncbi:hypothetical protein [Dubosiella newyorkensis]|uniref:hypothetical protein n=1 Tax=Dubosiella newyorkensis TaxID=1862672 RepID=UPI00259B6424|nr:hypothetical protein [Dubosiella newyorkensis]